MPRAEYLSHLASCALYVDSFPRTGGTAFPEALMAGRGVIGLYGGTWGYSCADALRVNDVEEFLVAAEKILVADGEMVRRQGSIRKECIEFHSPEAVDFRIKETMDRNIRFEPPNSLTLHGEPPILAELEFAAHGRTFLPRLSLIPESTLGLHGHILLTHAKHFGLLHKDTWRLFRRFLSYLVFRVKIGLSQLGI